MMLFVKCFVNTRKINRAKEAISNTLQMEHTIVDIYYQDDKYYVLIKIDTILNSKEIKQIFELQKPYVNLISITDYEVKLFEFLNNQLDVIGVYKYNMEKASKLKAFLDSRNIDYSFDAYDNVLTIDLLYVMNTDDLLSFKSKIIELELERVEYVEEPMKNYIIIQSQVM